MLRSLILTVLLCLHTAVFAEDRSPLWPEVPNATGVPHPEGNEYWRENHMTRMRHDRDLTMRRGDRKIGASLKNCFDCHTAKDTSGKVLSYADPGHFCRACHDFVAVKVDCFTCHRSTPEGIDEGSGHAKRLSKPGADARDATRILTYLSLDAFGEKD